VNSLDIATLPSPCFVIDECAVERNLAVLDRVQRDSGAKVLLALKGFALWRLFPLIREHLAGVCASGRYEARLGREEFGREVHVYAPAFGDDEFAEILTLADHLSFNSFSQWRRHRERAAAARPAPSCGLRINPEHREVETALYDPCAPQSRLGITLAEFEKHANEPGALDGIDGLHMHTLCELNSDALERTLAVAEDKFGKYLRGLKWFNCGGGHHISRADYDVERLIRVVSAFRERYGFAEVYLEPGEAIALNAGVLVATVLDLIRNEVDIAILDTSATAHMPDVLEMPYRPEVIALPDIGHDLAAGRPGEKPHTYRLGGLTCLAGDSVGDYSFDRPLHVGDKLIFADMAHYSMVKTTMFNGIPHPAIVLHRSDTGKTNIVRQFGYEDYRDRLG